MSNEEEDEAGGGDVLLKGMETDNEPMVERCATVETSPAMSEDASPQTIDPTPPTLRTCSDDTEKPHLTKHEIGVQVDIRPMDNNVYNNWQSVLILKFRRRLAEQEATSRHLLRQKDEQLSQITTNLYLLESKLRREQEAIERILQEKEAKIAELDKHLQQLLRLNRRLAAGTRYCTATTVGGIIKRKDSKQRQPRRITWHNEVHVIHEYETKTEEEVPTETKEINSNNCLEQLNGVEEEDEDVDEEDDGVELNRAINEACRAVDQALQEADPVINNNNNNNCWSGDTHSVFPRSNCTDPSLSSSDEAAESQQQQPEVVVGGAGTTFGIYNRIMNNHRTVTKPKDVKYKKISRVKSRSLEELRGRLRKPAIYSSSTSLIRDGHMLLEQEEIV